MIINKDIFNSEHFGIEMGNLILEDETYEKDTFKNAFSSIPNHELFKHLTLRVSTKDKTTTNAAVQNGFCLCDTLVEWVFIFNKSILPELNHKVLLRECEKKDLKEIKRISKNSFKIDRFHSDPYLSNDLCDKYYEKWVENSFNGYAEAIIIAEYDNKPVGYTTIKTYPDDEMGHLVLSAVSEEYRGLGIYTSLIHECVKWVYKKHPNLKGIIVGTQIDNIAVQKAWNRLGFTPFDSKYVLQRNIPEE